MEILQVVSPLVCTARVPGLEFVPLRVLRSDKGKLQVAVDPVGTRPGNWVFTISGSAARYATGDFGIQTDLTIGGIIDFWEEDVRDEGSSGRKTHAGAQN
jgi:carboxysome peptide B